MLRRLFGFVCALAMMLSVASIVDAHAVIFPKQVNADSYEKFSLRVPNEKDIPTTAVRVEVPEGFNVSRVLPLPGWEYELERDGSGAVVAVSWSGGQIRVDEFQEFIFQGKTAPEAGSYAWRAWQTYSDGTVVAWTGPSDADTPASTMNVIATGVQTDAHGVTSGAAAAGGTAGGFTTVAAYGGLILGAVGVVLGLRRRQDPQK